MFQNDFVRFSLLTLASIATTALIVGCGSQAAPPGPPAPTVTVSKVEQREIVEWDEFTGRTVPVETEIGRAHV